MDFKSLVWNVCGARKPDFLRAFRYLVQEHGICLAAVLETQISGPQAVSVCTKIGLNCYRVEANGRRGGIWLFWNHDVKVRVLLTDNSFLHAEVGYLDQLPLLLTVVYALPPVSGNEDYWETIAGLAPKDHTPWLVIGDFNAIVNMDERKGGSGRLRIQDRRFSEWIHRSSLIDLGFIGSPYTWSRNIEADQMVRKRLDRALGNEEWRLRWPEGTVRHLARFQSDHRPLLVHFSAMDQGSRRRRPFRFQAAWLTHPSFKRVVMAKWSQDSVIVDALEELKEELRKWNKNVFGNIELRKKRLFARLCGLQKALDARPNKGLLALDSKLKEELELVLHQEEMLWLQKSREKWIASGDRNTKYFHTSTVIRRRRNKVTRLQNGNGIWVTEPIELEELATNHYKRLYKVDDECRSCNWSRGHFPVWTEEECTKATRPISGQEVHKALFNMSPLKAPGIDGFQAIFFQRSWITVKKNLINFIQHVFEGGNLPVKLNDTLLAIIPKTPSPETIHQFRPISLCNVAYKLLTKIIVERLKPKLPELISRAQGSFVPGRQIADNVVILQEVLHSMRTKKGRKGWMAIKLDLEKAYDRLHWDFVEDTLSDAGIPSSLIRIIMKCVTGPTMRVLWNGEITEEFKPERGLRQGDPLSPYLFVACMERLAQWITLSERCKKWKPILLKRQGPSITHLLFADDIILFSEATMDQVSLIKTGLAEFCQASGQRISEHKSKVCFSANVPQAWRTRLSEELGIQQTSNLGKYLGIPALHSRVNAVTFQYLVEKAQARLAGWKAKQLSMAGRVTMVRSVLSTLPSYAMQTIYLPRSVCDTLDKMSRDFVWGDLEEHRRVHLVKWEEICLPREQGGLGIQSARKANDAFLTKLAWRYLSNKDDFWAQVLTAKYLKQGQQPYTLAPCSNRSAIWGGLMKVAKHVQAGLRWAVGDGQRIDFWRDKWIPGEEPLAEQGFYVPNSVIDWKISDVRIPQQGWNWDMLEDLLPEPWKDKVAAVFVDEKDGSRDAPSWAFTPNGQFSTKSAYIASLNCSNVSTAVQNQWTSIWKLKVPEKIRSFLWLCMKNKIMTNTERTRRRFASNPYCPICRNQMETTLHVLRDCPTAGRLWRSLLPEGRWSLFRRMELEDWVASNVSIHDTVGTSSSWNIIFAASCWWLWKWRNNEVFNCDKFQGDRRIFIHAQAQNFTTAWMNNLSNNNVSRLQVDWPTRWTPPQQGWWKLNTDGSSKGNPGPAGCGGVIRDANGHWCVGYMQNIGHCDALTAETWAVWYGLQVAKGGEFFRLVIESDSQLLIKHLTEGVESSHPLAALVMQCKNLIDQFGQVEVTFCSRVCNKLADSLANLALELVGGPVVLSCPPPSSLPLLEEDLASSLSCNLL